MGEYRSVMSFDVSASAYGRFMGQYSEPLAGLFADWSEVDADQRALDVGCGTGALTEVLAGRLGTGAVAAVDPSASFVGATRQRIAGVDVRLATAEELPFAWISRLLAAGPHPSKSVVGAELREFIAGASVVTDGTAIPSPPPAKNIFLARPGAD